METEKNETEQVDEVTEQPEEVVVEVEAEQDDELLTEEELEDARTVADYETKIRALDEKLAEYKAVSLAEQKREALRKFHYSEKQIERYIGSIKGNTAEEIQASVFELINDIPPVDGFADGSLMNGAKQKPAAADKTEIGRNIARRLLKEGKIR